MSLLSPFASPPGAVSDVNKKILPPPLLDGKENMEPESSKQKRKVTFITPARPESAAFSAAPGVGSNCPIPLSNNSAQQTPSQDQQEVRSCDPWSELRDLDDLERWSERSTVVTKADHESYLKYARDVVEELVASLPCYDEEEFRCASEMFSANGVSDFDMDFLDSVGTGQSQDAALARQSLYVRFDPLVNRPSPLPADRNPGAAFDEGITSTASGSDLLQLDTPRPTCPAVSRLKDSATPLAMPSLTPTGNAISFSPVPGGVPPSCTTQQCAVTTPTADDASGRAADQKADGVAARALPNAPLNLLDNATPILQRTAASQCTDNEESAGIAAGADEGSAVIELKFTEADLQFKIKDAVAEAVNRAKEQMSNESAIYDLELDRLSSETAALKTQSVEREELLKEMRQAVTQCQASAAERTDQSDAEIAGVINERNKVAGVNEQLRKDVESLDNSYLDLFSRFEKLRHTLIALQSGVADAEEKEKAARTLYDEAAVKCRRLKESAEEKLTGANSRMEQLRKDHTSEVAILNANVKKTTILIDNLHRSVRQKDDDKSKLTAICDDMMKSMESGAR
eukprot:scpid48714/ scgid27576/ Transforming acidic coiled-coil-containing protein 3; Cytoplasmic polyadenylation element-binding protein-associated factor Maskin